MSFSRLQTLNIYFLFIYLFRLLIGPAKRVMFPVQDLKPLFSIKIIHQAEMNTNRNTLDIFGLYRVACLHSQHR